MIKIEKTEVWITIESTLQLSDGRAIRGFFGNLYKNRPEFHGHRGNKLIYKHPFIQYKVFGNSTLVAGLKEGAYLLKAMPMLEEIEIYRKKYTVLKQNITTDIVPFGETKDMRRYSFITPWIALNEENYKAYFKNPKDNALLEKIVVGNILSMCKSIGYVVEGKIKLEAKFKEDSQIEVKKGLKLVGFQGEFKTNFSVPELWGIGKFSSRGYGTVRCNNRGKIND